MRRDAKPSSFTAFTDGWFRYQNSKSMGMCTSSRVLGTVRGSNIVHFAAAARGGADGGGIAYAVAIAIVIGDVRRFSAQLFALASGPFGHLSALTNRSTRWGRLPRGRLLRCSVQVDGLPQVVGLRFPRRSALFPRWFGRCHRRFECGFPDLWSVWRLGCSARAAGVDFPRQWGWGRLLTRWRLGFLDPNRTGMASYRPSVPSRLLVAVSWHPTLPISRWAPFWRTRNVRSPVGPSIRLGLISRATCRGMQQWSGIFPRRSWSEQFWSALPESRTTSQHRQARKVVHGRERLRCHPRPSHVQNRRYWSFWAVLTSRRLKSHKHYHGHLFHLKSRRSHQFEVVCVIGVEESLDIVQQ